MANKDLSIEYLKMAHDILSTPSEKLDDGEKILLSLIRYFYENGNVLYASNSTIGTTLGWNERKVQRVLKSLYNKKKIIFGRKSTNSPLRQLYPYDTELIKNYKKNAYPDKYVFDFLE